MFGVISLINIIGATAVWFLFLGKKYECGAASASADVTYCHYSDDLFYYTWMSVFIVHLFLWAPVAIMWPITYIGSLTPLMFLRAFCYISMAGPYGLYEGAMVAMVLAFIVWTDTSGLEDRGYSTSSGYIWFGSYGGLAVLNSVIQIYFLPSIVDWFLEVQKAEAAEDDSLEQLGFFDDAADDGGPIIFT